MRDYGPASVVRADDHGRALAGVSGAHRRNVTDRLSFPGSPWFPVLSMLSLESAAVASLALALALLIGPKPTCQRLSGP